MQSWAYIKHHENWNAFLACFSNSLSNETCAHPSFYHSSQFPWNHCTAWKIVRIVKVNKIFTKFVEVCGLWRRKTETRTVLFSTLFDSTCLDSLVHTRFWTNSGVCWWLQKFRVLKDKNPKKMKLLSCKAGRIFQISFLHVEWIYRFCEFRDVNCASKHADSFVIN